MSPQPASPPKDKPEPTPVAPTLAEKYENVPADERSAAQRQILRAHNLEKERAELQTKIGKNRDYLRLMDAGEELDTEQAAWLVTFYPEKEKGERRSAEEIEATRKAREAARK